jgi:hypothetical protein
MMVLLLGNPGWWWRSPPLAYFTQKTSIDGEPEITASRRNYLGGISWKPIA